MKLDKNFGICHICGSREKLTFEHVPPKSAFNNFPTKRYSYLDQLEKNKKPWEFDGVHHTINQRGNGYYSLCRSCNNSIGQLYGNAYKEFSLGVASLIGNNKDFEYISIKAPSVSPIAIMKQVLSMFCSINEPNLSAHVISFLRGAISLSRDSLNINSEPIMTTIMNVDNDLKEFILNPTCQLFDPKRYRLCMYIASGAVNRYVPLAAEVTHNVDMSSLSLKPLVSEIATYPLGFILYLLLGDEKDNDYKGIDITTFANCEYGVNYDLEITIPKYECNTVFPADFRTKLEVEDCAAKSSTYKK